MWEKVAALVAAAMGWLRSHDKEIAGFLAGWTASAMKASKDEAVETAEGLTKASKATAGVRRMSVAERLQYLRERSLLRGPEANRSE